jgi:hypothetical protein
MVRLRFLLVTGLVLASSTSTSSTPPTPVPPPPTTSAAAKGRTFRTHYKELKPPSLKQKLAKSVHEGIKDLSRRLTGGRQQYSVADLKKILANSKFKLEDDLYDFSEDERLYAGCQSTHQKLPILSAIRVDLNLTRKETEKYLDVEIVHSKICNQGGGGAQRGG